MAALLSSLVTGLILLAVTSAQAMVAPIPDEVLQKVVAPRTRSVKPGLPEAVRESLDRSVQILAQIEAEPGAGGDSAQDGPSLRGKGEDLAAERATLASLHEQARQQLALWREKSQALGLDQQVAALDELAAQVGERFAAADAALGTVLGEGLAAPPQAAASAKTVLEGLLDQSLAKAEPVPEGPIETLRQVRPLKSRPQPVAAEPPRYVVAPAGGSSPKAGPTALEAGPGRSALTTAVEACGCTEADLGQDQEEVRQTPEIRELAAKLDYSPRKIYQYIYENIEFEPYYGSLKGAQGTLISGAGGATDQASLLIALLRASDIPARYVRGVITVRDENPAGANGRGPRWLGAKGYNGAQAILASGLNPAAEVIVNQTQQAVGIELAHVWVEACVPYGHYRGAQIDDSGHRWLPLDPSFKNKTYQPGIAHNTNFDYTTYLAERQNGPDSLPHEAYAQQVLANIRTRTSDPKPDATLQDVPYKGTITPQQLDVLPSSLPYEVKDFTKWEEENPTSGSEAASLPPRHRYQFRVTIRNGDNDFLLERTLPMPDTVLRRITLSFKGATPADQTVLDAWEGCPYELWDAWLDPICPSLSGINVLPVVKVEGVEIGVGRSDRPLPVTSENNRLHLQVLLPELDLDGDCTPQYPPPPLPGSPEPDPSFSDACANKAAYTNISAANYHALQAYGFQTSNQLLEERAARLLASVNTTPAPATNLEETEGEYLHLVGLKYMRYCADAFKLVGALDGGSGNSGNHLGLTSGQMRVHYVFDLPFGVSRTGFLVDVPGGLSANAKLDTGAFVWKTFLLSGYAASAYESYIWQENAHIDAVSTVRGVQFAKENEVPLLTINATNWDTQSPKLTSNRDSRYNYPDALVQQLHTDYIQKGFTVKAPKSLIQYDDWKGAVYFTENSAKGKASFIISRYAGGFTTGQSLSFGLDIDLNTGFHSSILNDNWSSLDYMMDWIYQPPVTIGGGGVSTGWTQYNTTAADPVNMVTGNMYHMERDIEIPGRGGLPMVFERSYNSRAPKDGPLGYGWTHSLNHYLSFLGVENGEAKISWVDGTGAEKIFSTTSHVSGLVYAGTVMTNPPGFFCTFTRKQNGTYEIVEKNGLTYTFENVNGTSTEGGKAKLLSIKDRNGNMLRLNYHEDGKLRFVYDDLDRYLGFVYNQDNRISTVFDFSGRVHQYEYDANGNLEFYRNPLAYTSPDTQPPVRYTYYTAADGTFRDHSMKSYELPRGNGMTFEYYINGRVFRHTDSTGAVHTFTYNDFRRETVQTDPNGHQRRFFFDAYGNPLKIIEENGAELTYTYDENNPYNRLSKTDPLGHQTQYQYDANGNVVKTISPRYSTEEYLDFNAFGQAQRIKDHNGNYTVRSYSAKGNLLQEIRLKEGVVVSAVPYTPVPADILAWTLYSYDGYGNLLTTTRVRDAAAALAAIQAGDISALGQASTTVATTYDANSLYPTRIERIGDQNGDGRVEVDGADPVDSRVLEYDALGRPTKGIDAAWQPTAFTYDLLGRKETGTDAVGQVRRYLYDANGNLEEERLEIGAAPNTFLWDHTVIEYDLADRKEVVTDHAGAQTRYEYDALGNVVGVTDADGYRLGYTYDPANRVRAAEDQEGNRASIERDPDGKPKTETDANGLVTTYEYWGANRNGLLRKKTLPKAAGFADGRAVEYDYDAGGRVIAITEFEAPL
ncbi:MAG: DUF6531 domain-containing protein, partial [Thermodesulfobacteriota bacterium]